MDHQAAAEAAWIGAAVAAHLGDRLGAAVLAAVAARIEEGAAADSSEHTLDNVVYLHKNE